MRAAFVLCVLALGACQREAEAPVAPLAPLPVVQQPAAAPPAGAGETTSYVCRDGAMLSATYADAATARVEYKGRRYTLRQAEAASGVRYVGDGLQWWARGRTLGSIRVLNPDGSAANAISLECAVDVEPPQPGTPGGLPDDRTPISEAPFTPQSAQGAANVLQTYYANIEMRRYAEAARLRADGKAENFERFALHHAQVGAPGPILQELSSFTVAAPVVIYGRLMTGEEYHRSGQAVLRRANPPAGAAQAPSEWRIERVDLKP
ncbi:MliC family protein [Phenylobacterium sp.]|uniref:MliC family protein n=1 Tax=Phenylobacterium sp. TaxID=1871053 RepID=UPI00398398E9